MSYYGPQMGGTKVYAAEGIGSRLTGTWYAREITPTGETGPLIQQQRSRARPIGGGPSVPRPALYTRQIGPRGAEGPIRPYGMGQPEEEEEPAARVFSLHPKVNIPAYIPAYREQRRSPMRRAPMRRGHRAWRSPALGTEDAPRVEIVDRPLTRPEPREPQPCENWSIVGPYCRAVYQTLNPPPPVAHGRRPRSFDWVFATLPLVLGGIGGYWAHKKWPESKGRIAAAVGGGVAVGVLSPFVPILLLWGFMAITGSTTF